MDIDVNGLHQGFLKGLRQAGGELVCNAEVLSLARDDGTWGLATTAGDFAAPVVINAAGAWCDELAGLAGEVEGVISATGGMLSHFAIIAREMGLPVIVGADLSKIPEGEIGMDGGTGEIIAK